MSNSLVVDQLEKIPSPDMSSFINMLWDQDMDMGVDRHFYDPVLQEHELKKQQAEQDRLLQMKKKHAQKEMLYYTIDEETGERMLKPNAGQCQTPTEFTEDTDLSKELAELSEIAGLDYLLGEVQGKESTESEQFMENAFNNTAVQPQQQNYNAFNNMIIQTADQPNPVQDIDMWPTEITMLPGSTPESLPDICNPSVSDNGSDMGFISQLWDTDGPSNTGYFGGPYTGNGPYAAAPQYQNSCETKAQQQSMYHTVPASSHSYYNQNNGDAGVSDSFLDTLSNGNGNGNTGYSNQPFEEDVKPHFLFSQDPSNGSSQDMSGSSSSSGYAGSENGDQSSVAKSDIERERRNACRDEQRCKELHIPFSVEMVTNYPVEEFNSLLRLHKLTEEQLSVVKDIRRRGKNKVAAQNCRKKKMNELTGLEVEINDLKRKRSELVRDKDELKRSKLHLRKQLDQTYAEVFNSIRDHLGRPYDPRFYTLHISDDGDARIIPNKVSTYALLNYQDA